MSILSEVSAVAVSGLWKLGAIVTVAGAAASSAYFGYEWFMAAHDRDAARADLLVEQKKAADLMSAIHDHNIAISGLAAATKDATDKRAAAEKASADAIARGANRAAAVKASTATNCAGVLNEAWGGWK